MGQLRRPWLVVLLEQVPHRGERVARPGDHVEQHRVRDPEAGGQRLGCGRDQPVEGRLTPGHEAVRRLLLHDPAQLLLVVAGLAPQPLVLDVVIRRLHDHGAGGVVARSTGTPGHLVELAGRQVPHLHAVVLRQRRHEHSADRHVDADAEGVGAAYHLQQAGLGERLHQPAVARQHPRVVHADAVPHQPRQRPAEAGREAKAADSLGNGVPLGPGRDVDAGQRLGAFQCGRLGGVNDVHRCLSGRQQLLEGLVHRRTGVVEVQRHRSLVGRHHRGRSAGTPGEVVPEATDVTQRRRHQQELRPRQLEQRNLPGPAALRVGVVVELVHHDQPEVGVGPLPQRLVRDDLGGRREDRCLRVDRRVAGEHADVLGTEGGAQSKELLRHECLDRCCPDPSLAEGEAAEQRAGRDQALARPGGGREHDVAAGDELDQRLGLSRVELQALLAGPGGERVEQRVRVWVGGHPGGEGHDRIILPDPSAPAVRMTCGHAACTRHNRAKEPV